MKRNNCRFLNLLMFFSFVIVFGMSSVSAATTKKCGLDGEFLNFLQSSFDILKWVAPALVLVFTIYDLIKAATSQEKSAMNKAFIKTGKRIIYAIILFFIPAILGIILPWLNSSLCGIS